MNQKKTSTNNKTTNSTSKNKVGNKTGSQTGNKTGNNQVDSRMENFISAAINPDNNAFFEERSNPLCSKGD